MMMEIVGKANAERRCGESTFGLSEGGLLLAVLVMTQLQIPLGMLGAAAAVKLLE